MRAALWSTLASLGLLLVSFGVFLAVLAWGLDGVKLLIDCYRVAIENYSMLSIILRGIGVAVLFLGMVIVVFVAMCFIKVCAQRFARAVVHLTYLLLGGVPQYYNHWVRDPKTYRYLAFPSKKPPGAER